jgi:glycine dehydrogenase
MKTDSFALRHLGPSENDLPKMLETIGVETLDQLISELFLAIRLKKPLELEHIMTEYEYANHIRLLGRTNKVFKSYIGLATTQLSPCYSKKYFENPGWYTLYTIPSRNCSGSFRSYSEFSNDGY